MSKPNTKAASMSAQGVEKIRLSKPYFFDEKNGKKEYTEIILDFDSLTGEDLETAEMYSGIRANPALNGAMSEFTKPYLAVIGAMAAKQPFEFIKGLPAKDYTAVTVTVQNFLLMPSGFEMNFN